MDHNEESALLSHTEENSPIAPELYYKELMESINKELSNVVGEEFPPNLYNPMKYVLSGEGKRLRPILLIMACEAVGGKKEDAFDVSLAIEILHNFTLVHDDIMDNDDLRRGRLTVHKKWNANIAILAGDGLIALAYRYLLKTNTKEIRKVVKIFSEAIIHVCEGQSLDKDLEQADEVKIGDYIDMIKRKTGILMSVSAELGSILGDPDEAKRHALKHFGLELGIAFQIQDDLLDIISEEEVLGKDLGSDIEQGKKTYPIILFNEKASEEDKEKLNRTMDGKATPQSMKEIVGMLNKYDIIQQTTGEVQRRIKEANSYLLNLRDRINPEHLYYLSDKIKNRVY